MKKFNIWFNCSILSLKIKNQMKRRKQINLISEKAKKYENILFLFSSIFFTTESKIILMVKIKRWETTILKVERLKAKTKDNNMFVETKIIKKINLEEIISFY